MNDDDKIRLIRELADKIAPTLHGHAPEVQQATLAELLAIGLSGFQPHDGIEDREMTKFRETMLGDFVELVRSLLPGCVAAVARHRRRMRR